MIKRKVIKAFLALATLILVHPAQAQDTYTFGIVPQQSPIKTVRTWAPVVKYLSERTGKPIKIKTTKDIPTFEQEVLAGTYDFAYMNPAHYVIFHDSTGYQALAKSNSNKMHGILVAKKGGDIHSIKDLHEREVAFPAPGAFAATILNRSELLKQGILTKPSYVASHDSVYLNVAAGRYAAGGGVHRTLRNMPKEVRDQLVILHTTQGYTPHAIAAHPRVPADLAQTVRAALSELAVSPGGQKIVEGLKIKGFVPASDEEWDDVRSLNIDKL